MKHHWILGAGAALAVSAAASAQEARIEQAGPPPAPPPPTAEALAAPLRPDWIRLPTQQQLAGNYPSWTPKGMAATVKLLCIADANGKLTSCKVVEEAPERRGFGRTALEASRYYQMRPRSRDNVPVAGREVYVDVVWKEASR